MINKAAFFNNIRASLFKGKLSQKQVEGLESLIGTWFKEYGVTNPDYLAYCLATAYHETSHTMQPIEEYGKGKGRKYGVIDGGKYYGRGYVQLTWKANYQRAKDELGVDFVNKPQLALNHEYAAKILFKGCLEGWFTKYKLADYDLGNGYDFVNARRIVNGMDRAKLIAGYAEAFKEALSAGFAAKGEADSKTKATGKGLLTSTTNLSAVGGFITSALTAFSSINPAVAIVVVLVAGGFAAWIIRERMRKARDFGL